MERVTTDTCPVARIDITLTVAAPVADVWASLVDWESHTRWVPLTVVTITRGPNYPTTGLGTQFTGRTGLGPVGFHDPMEVTAWQPPTSTDHVGRCEITKLGRLVTGTAGFTLTPTHDGRTSLHWFEDVDIAPARLTRPFTSIIEALGRAGFTRALRSFSREVVST